MKNLILSEGVFYTPRILKVKEKIILYYLNHINDITFQQIANKFKIGRKTVSKILSNSYCNVERE